MGQRSHRSAPRFAGATRHPGVRLAPRPGRLRLPAALRRRHALLRLVDRPRAAPAPAPGRHREPLHAHAPPGGAGLHRASSRPAPRRCARRSGSSACRRPRSAACGRARGRGSGAATTLRSPRGLAAHGADARRRGAARALAGAQRLDRHLAARETMEAAHRQPRAVHDAEDPAPVRQADHNAIALHAAGAAPADVDRVAAALHPQPAWLRGQRLRRARRSAQRRGALRSRRPGRCTRRSGAARAPGRRREADGAGPALGHAELRVRPITLLDEANALPGLRGHPVAQHAPLAAAESRGR